MTRGLIPAIIILEPGLPPMFSRRERIPLDAVHKIIIVNLVRGLYRSSNDNEHSPW